MALRRNGESSAGGAIRRSRFVHVGDGDGVDGGDEACLSIYEDRRRLERDSDSCSSSSVGRNSDLSGDSSIGEYSGDEDEVQSSFKGPLDTMDALEEVLPIKRGMSNFYSGKSKSFTSLADAVSVSSVKAIAKPENPYNKKRKNLLSRANLFDKTRHRSLQNFGTETTTTTPSTSKRLSNFGRTAFLVGETSDGDREESSSVSTSPSCSGLLPPLHPQPKRSPPVEPSPPPPPPRQSPWRSFSLSDLQSVCASTPNITGLVISAVPKKNEIH